MAVDFDDGSRHGTSQDANGMAVTSMMGAEMGHHRIVASGAGCAGHQAAGRATLEPLAHTLDDGTAYRRFSLYFAGNLARTLVFVNANRRHQFLLPDQGFDEQARIQHRDGDYPSRWVAMAGSLALPDVRSTLGERLDIDDLMATIGMKQRRERMLLVTVDDVPEADAVSIIETDPHPAPMFFRPERWSHLPPLPIEPGHASDLIKLPVDHDGAGGPHARQGVFVGDIPVERENPRPRSGKWRALVRKCEVDMNPRKAPGHVHGRRISAHPADGRLHIERRRREGGFGILIVSLFGDRLAADRIQHRRNRLYHRATGRCQPDIVDQEVQLIAAGRQVTDDEPRILRNALLGHQIQICRDKQGRAFT